MANTTRRPTGCLCGCLNGVDCVSKSIDQMLEGADLDIHRYTTLGFDEINAIIRRNKAVG